MTTTPETPGRQGGLLLVGAHIADMEFTAGHLARLHALAGEPVTILHLTAGEGGHPGMEPAAYRVQKLEEARQAAEVLGVSCRVLDTPDGSLVPSPDVVDEVSRVLTELAPSTVVTHWRGSFHPDHANTFFTVEAALARVAKDGLTPQLWFPDNWEDADGYRPDVFVDITPVYDDWLQAARCHQLFRGGVVPFDYQGYYVGLSAIRGRLSGVERAAGFMSPPSIFAKPLSRLG